MNEIAPIIAMPDSAAKRLRDYGIRTQGALRDAIEREPGVVALVANVSLERVWAWMGELDPSILAENNEGVQP